MKSICALLLLMSAENHAICLISGFRTGPSTPAQKPVGFLVICHMTNINARMAPARLLVHFASGSALIQIIFTLLIQMPPICAVKSILALLSVRAKEFVALRRRLNPSRPRSRENTRRSNTRSTTKCRSVFPVLFLLHQEKHITQAVMFTALIGMSFISAKPVVRIADTSALYP